MTKKENDWFAKKYGLEGKGRPVRIDPQTAAFVRRIIKMNDRLLESGREWARTYKGTFRK